MSNDLTDEVIDPRPVTPSPRLDPTTDELDMVAHFAAIATQVRTEFTMAVEHLTNAVRLAYQHRIDHDVVMRGIGLEAGVTVMANTRMVDVTLGRLDVRPVDAEQLAHECTVRAMTAAGLAMNGQTDAATGPSTQIR